MFIRSYKLQDEHIDLARAGSSRKLRTLGWASARAASSSAAFLTTGLTEGRVALASSSYAPGALATNCSTNWIACASECTSMCVSMHVESYSMLFSKSTESE